MGSSSEFLCESKIVTEYIMECHGLLPPTYEDRAIVRTFYELCGKNFESYFPLLQAMNGNDSTKLKAAIQTFREGLIQTNAYLEEKSINNNSSNFLLNDFSLAECYMAPFVQRCCMILPNYNTNVTKGLNSFEL